MSDPALPGERIGAYVVERELARGGMGVVYVARHEDLGRRVALKVLLSDHDQTVVHRFQSEARALAQLRHPHVVPIHEVGEDGGRPFIVMDLVAGESLKQRLDREQTLDQEAAVRLVEQLARALEHAHQRGIVHRDVKPANVLLDEAGRPLLTDFGLAKDLSNEKTRLTQTGTTLGTPGYMPPEQANGDPRAIDGRADVYSLGATLYALLTGRPPFSGASLINILNAVLTKPPTPPSQLRADLAPDLETICLTCLAKAPGERYASAGALADDLARHRQGEPIEARRPSRLRRLLRWGGRHWVPLAAVAALAVVGAGLLSWTPPAAPRGESLARSEAQATPSPVDPRGPDPRIARLALSDGVRAFEQEAYELAFDKLAAAWRGGELLHPHDRFLAGGVAVQACYRWAYTEQATLDKAVKVRIFEKLSEAIRIDPTSYECRFARTQLALDWGRRPKAWIPLILQDMQVVLPRARSDADRATFSLYMGRILHKLGRGPEAIPHLNRALSLRPGRTSQPYRVRGEIHERLGNNAEARRDYALARKINPNDRLATYYLGRVLEKLGKPKAALAALNAAIRVDRERHGSRLDPNPLLTRARVQLALKRYAPAIADYEQVLEIKRLSESLRDQVRLRLKQARAAQRTGE